MNDVEFFGSDIALDENGDAVVAVNGELRLTEGIDTLCQDIRLRLATCLGTLFYDDSYGSNLPLFINDDEADAVSIETEIVRRAEADPRIEPYSVEAKVLTRTEKGVTVSLSWRCTGSDNAINETIFINKSVWQAVHD